MGDLMVIAVVLFLTVVAPLFIIFHFITKWKSSREMSQDDEQLMEDMWRQSQRLQERIETLEKILDDDLPEWRKK